MSNTFYSILPAIVAIISSGVLFLSIKRSSSIANKNFLRHYAFAFVIASFFSLPVFLINLGVETSYNDLLLSYGLIAFTLFISYALFFRGTAILFTRDRFFSTILPLLVLPTASGFSIVVLLLMGFPTLTMYTAIAWGFLFVNNNLLGSIFLYSFATGSPIKNMKGKSCALILALGWFALLGLDIILWIQAALYHPEFWVFKIVSFNGWFLARAVVYLVILAGALRCNKCSDCLQLKKEE